MNPAVAAFSLEWEIREAYLAQMLYEKGAIKFGSFELKNPDLSPSPIYIDLRTKDNPKPGPLRDGDIGEIAQELLRTVSSNGLEYDFVCGIPNAGEPITKAFMALTPKGSKRRAFLQKSGEGDKRVISSFKASIGFWCTLKKFFGKQTPKRVLLVDDVVSGADTKLEAARVVEEAGYEVAGFSIAVDREQGGVEYLESLGYKVFCWKELSELLRFYYLTGAISWGKKSEILKYIERTKPIIAPL